MNKIIDLMKICETKGYSATASAAVVGNWIAEGALNEKNVSLDRFTNGYREVGALGFTAGVAESYLVWCRNNNKAWDDFVNQAEYALEKTVPAYYPMFHEFGIWRYFQEIRMYLNCYTTLDAFKKAVPDLIETATISFMCLWWSPTYKQIKGGLTWASRDSGKYELTFDQRLQQEIRDRTKYAKEAYAIYKEGDTMKDYIQSDPRWASKPYAGETMAAAGCGPTAVADVISIVCEKTPAEVADYITSIGGASNGYGTFWEAITCACNHFGMECKQLNTTSMYGITDSKAEKEFIELLMTGEYVGILLLGNGFFAKNGHYIAVVYIDGKWYIKVLDVAYSPRSVCVPWTAIAPYNAPGNATGQTVPYFRGKVKVFYAVKKKKSAEPIPNKTAPTSYVTTFRQIKYGDKDMPEIYIWKEFMIAEGRYSGKLDFVFDAELDKVTRKWQETHTDWTTKKPLAVDGVVGPCSWKRAMHMTGSPSGSKISFILREKEVGETGTTCRFAQKVEKARGMYGAAIDNSNGNKNAAGNIAYKKARGFKEISGKITCEMLKDMCGGL